MIDIQLLRTNLDAVTARLATRGYVFDKEAFLSLENERKQIQTETQTLQASRNAINRKIGQARGKGEDAAPLMAEANAVNEKLDHLEKKLEDVQRRLHDFLAVIPNPPHDSVPAGKSADDNVEQRRWGTPRAFEFEPQNGTLPYDLLLEETNPEHVDMELDLYWIVRGGQDPLAYFAVDRWLADFAYRVDVGRHAGVFVLAGITALAVALVTVGYHALRAAHADPVKALRYE